MRKRGRVQRIHRKVNMISDVLSPNQIQLKVPRSRNANGGCQPPKNSVAPIADISPIKANSEAWIRAQVIPEYSTMNPPTISLSPSGRSNGIRFTSAMLATVASIAEVKRIPFDLPEGESEIVGGFMVEYSGMTWALIQASEFALMGLMSAIGATLFFGGWQPPFAFLDLGTFNWIWFGLKTSLIMFTFLWIRWTLPRLRMDQLMDLGWKVLVPLTILWLFVTAGAVLAFPSFFG